MYQVKCQHCLQRANKQHVFLDPQQKPAAELFLLLPQRLLLTPGKFSENLLVGATWLFAGGKKNQAVGMFH